MVDLVSSSGEEDVIVVGVSTAAEARHGAKPRQGPRSSRWPGSPKRNCAAENSGYLDPTKIGSGSFLAYEMSVPSGFRKLRLAKRQAFWDVTGFRAFVVVARLHQLTS